MSALVGLEAEVELRDGCLGGTFAGAQYRRLVQGLHDPKIRSHSSSVRCREPCSEQRARAWRADQLTACTQRPQRVG